MPDTVVTTVDVSKIEAAFEKKLNDKDSAIAKLQSEIDEFKKSVAKSELDKRDSTIAELQKTLDGIKKDLVTHQSLVAERDEQVKSVQTKIDELTEQLKVKTDESEKLSKELEGVKAKQVLANRIAQYRDKSDDNTTKAEDLEVKFGSLTDSAFATVLEFVKKPESPANEDPAKLAAKATAAPIETNKPEVPPTSTAKPEDPMRAIAARLIGVDVAAILFGKTEKKTE
jgi:chromosome segregation ATPase